LQQIAKEEGVLDKSESSADKQRDTICAELFITPPYQ